MYACARVGMYVEKEMLLLLSACRLSKHSNSLTLIVLVDFRVFIRHVYIVLENK